jgi:D-alanine-D-alanine ligase
MAKKLTIGVIFGGRSGEHEISIRSARSVIEALDQRKYNVVPIAITLDGRWLPPAVSLRLLPEATQTVIGYVADDKRKSVALTGDPGHQGLLSLGRGDIGAERLDVVFPVLHGTYGEDGTIQGLLDMAGIPYVGCGVLASSCGMDKVVMKALFRDAGLPICLYTWFLRTHWEKDPQAVIRRVVRELGFPCFVKPANLGSSVGVSRANNRAELKSAIELAARYDRKIVVEEGLDAREIECAVMGNDEPAASLPGEYLIHDAAASFLDYEEKYSGTGHNEFVVPARLNRGQIAAIQRHAITAFKAVDGSGLARVDFFLRKDTGELLVNELNTMPGLTDVSGFPKMWAASGVNFPAVLDSLVGFARERRHDKERNAVNH